MITLTIEIDDEMQKALEWEIADLQGWATERVMEKAKSCANEIIQKALEDNTHTILSEADKLDLQTYLNNQGYILNPIINLPENIKREIIKRAVLPN